MRYPKAWDADSNVGVSTHYHSSDGEPEKRHCICLNVFKPGTPHHRRRVIARLTRDEAIKVYRALESQLAVRAQAAARLAVKSATLRKIRLRHSLSAVVLAVESCCVGIAWRITTVLQSATKTRRMLGWAALHRLRAEELSSE